MVWKLFIHVWPPIIVSNFSQSGYNQLVSLFSDYSQPIFFSEFGCNLVEPRLFTEVGAICTSNQANTSNAQTPAK